MTSAASGGLPAVLFHKFITRLEKNLKLARSQAAFGNGQFTIWQVNFMKTNFFTWSKIIYQLQNKEV